jgi:Ser/Thr protein kinase RdoA (MazF antagonist)
MQEELVGRMVRKYGYEPVRVLPPQKGYRNQSWPVVVKGGETLNLILYKREPDMVKRIKRADSIAACASTQGLPVRTSLSPRIIRLRAGEYTRYGALYTYLPGATIPWEAYTMEHIKTLGAMLSRLHEALRGRPLEPVLFVHEEYSRLTARMSEYFGEPGVTAAMQSKLHLHIDSSCLTFFNQLLRYCCHLPGQQWLHMDFVRGNILYGQDTSGKPIITGVLDFEKTAYGHPAFDLARTLAFLLVDCKYKDEAKIRKYFLPSGYNKRGPAHFRNFQIKLPDGSTYDLLETLIDLFLIYDFYKFLRHNPYEALRANEHFVRTRDLLFHRGRLAQA